VVGDMRDAVSAVVRTEVVWALFICGDVFDDVDGEDEANGRITLQRSTKNHLSLFKKQKSKVRLFYCAPES